jgi:hypothetical protein
MPKLVTKGSGMMRRKMLFFDAETEGAELFAYLRANPILGPDEAREKNARHVRDMLARATEGKPEHWLHALPEADALRIMADWLIAFDRLARERSKPDPDPAMIAMHAEDCGRIQERLWWRAGVDPETRERREELALQTRTSRLALNADRDGGRASANAERHAEAEEWREVAREVAAASPFGGARLETRILEELKCRGFSARSGPAIRKAIKGIGR